MVNPLSQKRIAPASQCSYGDGHWRLGCLASTWKEAMFLMAISSSQVLDEYITSGFFVLIPALMHDFSLAGRAMTWPTSITSMVVSAFLLLFGRAVDMYGGAPVYVTGIAWTSIWTLCTGFAMDVPTLILCRAMQGLGTAAYLPAGLAMLGTLYPPGPRKNMAFSIYGAMAPLGSFIGILIASLALQYACWRWYFWIGAFLALVTLSGFLLAGPSTSIGSRNRDIHMDWLGGMSLAVTAALLIFTVTEAADATRGQHTLYVLTAGILAVVGIIVTALIETHIAKQPLLPALVLKVRCMRPLLLGLVLNYGAVSLYSCYSTL
jgi:MFS family permease